MQIYSYPSSLIHLVSGRDLIMADVLLICTSFNRCYPTTADYDVSGSRTHILLELGRSVPFCSSGSLQLFQVKQTGPPLVSSSAMIFFLPEKTGTWNFLRGLARWHSSAFCPNREFCLGVQRGKFPYLSTVPNAAVKTCFDCCCHLEDTVFMILG